MYDKPKSSISTFKKKKKRILLVISPTLKPESHTLFVIHLIIIQVYCHRIASILPSQSRFHVYTYMNIYIYIYTYNCSKVDRIWKFQTSLCFKNPYILSSPGYFSDIVRFCEVSICNMKYCQYDLLGVPVAIRESVDSA